MNSCTCIASIRFSTAPPVPMRPPSCHAHTTPRCCPSPTPPCPLLPPACQSTATQPTVTRKHPVPTSDLIRTVGGPTLSTHSRLWVTCSRAQSIAQSTAQSTAQLSSSKAIDRKQSTVSIRPLTRARGPVTAHRASSSAALPARPIDRPARQSTVSAPRAAHPRVPHRRRRAIPRAPLTTATPVAAVGA